MARRSRRLRQRKKPRPSLLRRIRRLFSSKPSFPPWNDDPDDGGLGVREPRRPLRPNRSGAVALEPPPQEKWDVRAVGEEQD